MKRILGREVSPLASSSASVMLYVNVQIWLDLLDVGILKSYLFILFNEQLFTVADLRGGFKTIRILVVCFGM